MTFNILSVIYLELMGYYFARYLLLRMPAGNATDYTADLSLILVNPVFRTAVLLASPVFYARLKQSEFLLELLSEKQQMTLRKYYNRFCFRPTPFGLFSSVTLTSRGENPVTKTDSVSYQVKIRADQTYQAALTSGAMQEKETADAIFDPNPSIYRVLKEFRFLRTGLDETFGNRNYSLQSIVFSKILSDMLSFGRGGKTGDELVSYIALEARCMLGEVEAYLEFLLDAQVLLNRIRPNITGEDFLDL